MSIVSLQERMMNKHLLGYGVLVGAVAILAGQIVTQKDSQKQVEIQEKPKPIIETKIVKDEKAEKELAKLRADLKEKDEHIAKLRETIDKKVSEVNDIKKSAKLEKVEKTDKKGDLVNLLESVSGMMDNEQMRKSQKRFMKRRYAKLFKKLNLSEEDQEKLLDLMIDRDKQKQAKIAELMKNSENGLTFDMESLSAMKDDTEANQDIKEFLGDDYDKFDRYEKTGMERHQLKDITASLEDSDSLSEDQEEKLIDIMSERNKERMKGSDVDDEKYVSQASEFLSENQTEEVRKSFKRNKGRNFFSSEAFSTGGGSNIQIMTFP